VEIILGLVRVEAAKVVVIRVEVTGRVEARAAVTIVKLVIVVATRIVG
jgi:hypothetical protein